MKINSLFNALIRVKNQLKGSINNQNETLQALVTGFLPDIESDVSEATASVIDSNKKITLLCGEIAQISKIEDTTIYNITLSKKNDDTPQSITIDISSIDFEDFDFTAPLIEGYDATMNDILHSLSEGSQINNVILDINNLFLNKPTYSVGEILNVIQSYDYNSMSDIKTLKEFIVQSSVNGEVSNYGWAQLLSKITQDSFDTIEETESFEVIEEKFFALQSFMSTVLTVLTVTFSIVVTVLSAIFKGLWIALSFIFEFVGNVFNTVFDTNYKINASSTYPGITGTFKAGPVDKTYMTYASDNSITKHDHNLMRIPHGCEDIYYFTQEDANGNLKTYLQSQLMLTYHPDRVIEYIRTVNLKEFTPVVGRSETYELSIDVSFQPWNDDDPTHVDPFLTSDELIQITTDQTFMKRCIAVNVMMLYFQRILGVSRQAFIDLPVHSEHGLGLFAFFNFGNDYPSHAIAYSGANAWLSLGNGVMDLWRHIPNPNYDFTYWHNHLDNMYGGAGGINRISGMINDFITLTNNTSSLTQMVEYTGTEYYGGLCYTSPIIPNELDGIYTLTNVDTNVVNITHNAGLLDISDVDFIPTEDLINLPSVSQADIIAAILIVVATITVATIAAKKVGSFVKSFFQRGKAKRIGTLNGLRESFVKDPTNKQKAKAYRKALQNYNFKASLLGWNQYDSANGWLNADASSSIDDLNNVNSLSGWESVAKLIK